MKRNSANPRISAPCATALLALTVLIALGGCSRPKAESAAAQAETAAQAVLVNAADVVLAQSRSLQSGVAFTGELSPLEIVEVVARFDGDLEAVNVREGQAVHAGQPLARYRPRDVKDAMQAAEAELLSARATLVAAQNAERRAGKLLEAGAAAPSDLEGAQSARAAAEARVRSAEALYNHSKEDADRLDVPAPISGRVSKVIVHGGDRTAVGDPMITLVNTDALELSATVPSEALNRLQVGATIEIRVDGFPGEVFSGHLDRVNPTTESGTRQVRIYSRVANEDGRLVGGLFATGRVVDAKRENVLAAPVSVIRREGQEQVVYHLRDGRAARVPVRTGLLDEGAGVVELIGALSPGDSLLSGVVPGIRDGAPVRVLAENGTGAAGK